ncbi:heat shock protein DnaJ, partial [Myriangium duriaei CBS 260.36]
MSSPPIPDPYLALGLPKDTTAAQVKTTYRKLALKFHPDKVTDESLKASAADNFHRIQQAYEILSDEDKRAKYD